MTEPRAMREVHEIREKISVEEKGLTAAEKTARVSAEMAEIKKKYEIITVGKISRLRRETNG